MKKVLAAILAIIMCSMFSSCKKNVDVVTEQTESLTDLIESETEETVLESASETKFAAVQTSETQTEADSETNAETQQTTESKMSETETAAKNENIGMISELHFTYNYPETNEYLYFQISPRHQRVYVIAWGGNEKNETGFITDKQVMKLTETINGMNIAEYNGSDNNGDNDASMPLNNCSLNITDADGKTITANFMGDIPEAFDKLVSVLNEFAADAYSSDDFSEKAQFGIGKAVDALVYCRSYLNKLSDTGGDCSVYGGKTLVITENDLDPLGEAIWSFPEDWYGYAFVKFTADGTDVEYVNWSETEVGLSEEKLVYDDLEAYYIENGTIIGATLEE
ncbi:MAG: hypothetical protein ACI4KG_01915 [Oscillospiraceae bacterium]